MDMANQIDEYEFENNSHSLSNMASPIAHMSPHMNRTINKEDTDNIKQTISEDGKIELFSRVQISENKGRSKRHKKINLKNKTKD